jgi:hypothetical protein
MAIENLAQLTEEQHKLETYESTPTRTVQVVNMK